MNYFAHAYRFLDCDPYFVAGTAVPDWLTVADRPARVRAKHVHQALHDLEPRAAAVARGILQHLHDDARFHDTRCFFETVVAVNATIRDGLDGEVAPRSGFVGHLLVEVLLDAALIEEAPTRLDHYYRLLDQVDPQEVQAAVNRMAPKPAERLAGLIAGFRSAEILRDYADDARLMVRLNQVMRRVGLEPLPDRFCQVLPEIRDLVQRRKGPLLEGTDVRQAFQPDRTAVPG